MCTYVDPAIEDWYRTLSRDSVHVSIYDTANPLGSFISEFHKYKVGQSLKSKYIYKYSPPGLFVSKLQYCHAIAIVFSYTDLNSFELIDSQYWKPLHTFIRSERFPFLLVGNKSDCSPKAVCSAMPVALASKYNIPFLETRLDFAFAYSLSLHNALTLVFVFLLAQSEIRM